METFKLCNCFDCYWSESRLLGVTVKHKHGLFYQYKDNILQLLFLVTWYVWMYTSKKTKKNSIDLLICIHPNHIVMHSKFNLLLLDSVVKVCLRSLILTKRCTEANNVTIYSNKLKLNLLIKIYSFQFMKPNRICNIVENECYVQNQNQFNVVVFFWFVSGWIRCSYCDCLFNFKAFYHQKGWLHSLV